MAPFALDQEIAFIAQLFSNTRLRHEFIVSIVEKLRDWTGCECVGIRILNPAGYMPYEAYVGFSREFWEHENWLSVRDHQCGCIRVMTREFAPLDRSLLTEQGAIWTNDLQAFGRSVPPELAHLYRGQCIDAGFATLAVLPIWNKGRVLGLIHLADARPDRLPREKVQILEAVCSAIGEVIFRFTVEETLQQKQAEIEHFVYTISHDLKSPLVTIQTFLGLLHQDLAAHAEDKIAKDVDYIRGAADKMEQLLGALLQFSRVGRMDRPAQTVVFDALVAESLAALAGALTEKQVAVQVHAVPLTLYGDPLRLAQIWQNLLENAVKYLGEQPEPRIEVGVEIQGGSPVFFVRDNGIGIAAQDRERIFQLFAKLDPRSEGSGLGLALVKKIVENYQGTIWVESQGPGQGSCFRFTLPAAVVAAEF